MVAAACAWATTALAAQLHVPDQFPTIQAAVDAAASGDEIVIAPGVYNDTIDIVSKNDITLRSIEGAEKTILDGTQLGRTILRVEEGSTGIAIEGLTLQNSDPTGGTFTSVGVFTCCGYNGGAMLVWGGSEVTIKDCVFRDNALDAPPQGSINWVSRGAGLAVIQGSSVTVSASQFVNNSLPAEVVNGAHGGGAIYIDQVSLLVVTDSKFQKNHTYKSSRGGAINLAGQSSGTIMGCTFIENSANRGGAIEVTLASELDISNSKFLDNTATLSIGSRGGAISSHGEDVVVTITECHFSGNVANWTGGSVQHGPGNHFIANSSFCDSSPDHIYGHSGWPPWQDGGGNTFSTPFSPCPEPQPGDLNGDGSVGVPDLLILLAAWGNCPPPSRGDCPADLNGDGSVGVADLLVLLANWG